MGFFYVSTSWNRSYTNEDGAALLPNKFWKCLQCSLVQWIKSKKKYRFSVRNTPSLTLSFPTPAWRLSRQLSLNLPDGASDLLPDLPAGSRVRHRPASETHMRNSGAFLPPPS